MIDEITTHRNDAAVQQRLAAMFSANKDEISIPKIYVDMTEDIKAAAVLDELMFWTLPKRGKTSLRVFRNGGLWLAVRRADWWDRKRLTERQSDTAIEKLVELDLIEKDLFLFDGKPTVHIRVKMSNFVKLYGEKMQELVEENDETLVKDISDLYAMMGFPNQNVNPILQNGEMLNLQNGEIINNLQQPPNTSSPSSENSNSAKPKVPDNYPNEWKIFAGEEINKEWFEESVIEKEALLRFESDLQTPGNWNWYPARTSEEKAWKYLRDFVIEKFKEDKNCFQKYQTWRTQPYARGAMSNLAIKRNPENFPASWTDFLASSAMYGKPEAKSQDIKLDDHGAPISY